MMLGGFAGSLYAAIAGLTGYNLVPVASFLVVLNYTGGTMMNVVNGVISGVIGFVVAAIATYIIGLGKDSDQTMTEPNVTKEA